MCARAVNPTSLYTSHVIYFLFGNINRQLKIYIILLYITEALEESQTRDTL